MSATSATGRPSAVIHDFSVQVVFRLEDGTLVHTTRSSVWKNVALDRYASAAKTAGNPVVWTFRDQLHVTYRADDGKLIDLWSSYPGGGLARDPPEQGLADGGRRPCRLRAQWPARRLSHQGYKVSRIL